MLWMVLVRLIVCCWFYKLCERSIDIAVFALCFQVARFPLYKEATWEAVKVPNENVPRINWITTTIVRKKKYHWQNVVCALLQAMKIDMNKVVNFGYLCILHKFVVHVAEKGLVCDWDRFTACQKVVDENCMILSVGIVTVHIAVIWSTYGVIYN